MSVGVVLRLHRIPQFCLGVGFVILLASIFRQPLSIPGADGIRIAQEVFIAFTPALLGICTVPPLGEVRSTTLRGPQVDVAVNSIFVLGSTILCAWLWHSSGAQWGALHFELFLSSVLVASTILTTRRWGASGLVLSAGAGAVLLMFWDGLAGLMGFQGFTNRYGMVHQHTSVWGLVALFVAGAVVVFAIAVDPHRPLAHAQS